MMDAVAGNDQRAPGVGGSASAGTLFAETQPLGRWNHTAHTVHSHGYSILGYHVHHSEVMNLGTSIQGNDMDAPHGSGTSSGETSNAISEQCIMTRGRSTNKDAHYIIGTTTESGARASDAGAQTFTGTQETGAMTQRQATLYSRNTARDARTDDRSRSREAVLRHHTASGDDTLRGQADICGDLTGSTRALADSGTRMATLHSCRMTARGAAISPGVCRESMAKDTVKRGSVPGTFQGKRRHRRRRLTSYTA